MPTFWEENGPIHIAIFTKVLCQYMLTLKDLGLDSLGELTAEFNLAADSVDSLGVSILTGVLGWAVVNPKAEWWYRDLTEIVKLLRQYVVLRWCIL